MIDCHVHITCSHLYSMYILVFLNLKVTIIPDMFSVYSATY